MKIIKRRIILIFALILIVTNSYSQVTIGSGTPPATAALLDLKSQEGANGGATTGANGGGLLLPRIELQSKTSLKPFAVADSDISGQRQHTGLMVYNLTPTGGFTAGVYTWDGAKWVQTGSGEATSGQNAWNLTGNSGINPSVNYIGSTNEGGHILFKTGDTFSGLLMSDDATNQNLNTAFGTDALNLYNQSYLTYSYNTAIGARALGVNKGNANTAVGSEAALNLANGSYNTAIGRGSLRGVTSGSNNVAIGYNVLSGNNSGNSNIGIGNNSGSNLLSGTNNIIIGSNQNTRLPSVSNELNIGGAIFGTGLTGNATAPAGNIGIGTSTPNSSAILDLTSDNKGVLFPRVSLTSIKDQTTVASPAIGLLVYNTATAGTAPNDVAPGYYYWDGNNWSKMNTSSTSQPSWVIGEERAFMYSASYSTFNTNDDYDKLRMSGKNIGDRNNTKFRLLSTATTIEGGDISGALIINGLRLDFLREGFAPKLVNTTANAITYSIVTWSTYDNYYDGTKTTIAPGAISFKVDGDNNLGMSNNDRAEAVHGMIVFTTGEWYAFMFYPIWIDDIIQGYTTARRIR